MVNKKGVSSVILSSLLILIVIVIVVIIAVTMKTLTSSVEEGVIKTQCDLENPDNIEGAQNCILAKMGKDVPRDVAKDDKKKTIIPSLGYVVKEKDLDGQEILTYYEDKPLDLETDGYIVEFYEEPLLVTEKKEKDRAKKLKEEGKINEANSMLNSLTNLKENQLQKIKNEKTRAIEDMRVKLGRTKISKDVRDIDTLKITGEYSDLINAIAFDMDYVEMEKIKDSPYIKKIYPNTLYEANLMDSVSGINADFNSPNLDCNTQVQEGLVAHYCFDNDVSDSSQMKNNGEAIGELNYISDGWGTYANFSKNTGYVKVENDSSLNSQDQSYNFWIKIDSIVNDGSYFPIIYKGSKDLQYLLYGPYDSLLQLIKNPSTGKLSIQYGAKSVIDRFPSLMYLDIPDIRDGSWHMVSLVRSSQSFVGYVDGEMVVTRGFSRSSNWRISEDNLFIGSSLNYNLSGAGLDNVMIYNRTLNSDEINQIYNESIVSRNYTGNGTTIAIIDTGVDYTHPDLGGCTNVAYDEYTGDHTDYNLETDHPLSSSYFEWNISMPGYTNMTLHFVNISTSNIGIQMYENIFFYGKNNNLIGKLYGNYNDYLYNVKEDFVSIRINNTKGTPQLPFYGFVIDEIINGSRIKKADFSDCEKVIGGWDFVNNDADPIDDAGHGTHVASIAAGKGVLNGAAPEAKILAYKVLSSSGSGSMANVIAAMEKAVLDGADIISMSLGANCGSYYSSSCGPNDLSSIAADNAVDSGVVVVVAAGNSGPTYSTIGSPATARKAIAVGATYKKDYVGTYWQDVNPKKNQIAPFSSRGPVYYNGEFVQKPDVLAPGAVICAARYGNIYPVGKSTYYYPCVDEKHVQIAGTSMSAPLVSGAIALIKEAHSDWSAEEIKMALRSSAKDIKQPMNISGYGIIDTWKTISFKGFPSVIYVNNIKDAFGLINLSGNISGRDYSNYSVYHKKNDSLVLIGSGTGNISVLNFDTSILNEGENILRFVARNIYDSIVFEDKIVNVDNIQLTSPLTGDLIEKNGFTDIKGSLYGQIDRFYVKYGPTGSNQWSDEGIILSPLNQNGEINNDVIARWNKQNLLEGYYDIKIILEKNGVNRSEVFSRIKLIDNVAKVIPLDLVTKKSSVTSVSLSLNSIRVEDIDGDGSKDFIYYENVYNIQTFTSDTYIHIKDNEGNYLEGWPIKMPGTYSGCNIIDIDNDATKEIICNNGASISSYESDGTKSFGDIKPVDNLYNYPGYIPGSASRGFSKVQITDIDNDGNQEIIAKFYWWTSGANADAKYSGVAIYDNLGQLENAFRTTNFYAGSASSNDALTEIADFDNDGTKEILVYKSLGTMLLDRDIMIYNRTGYLTYPFSPNNLGNIGAPIIVDLDNDGTKEIVNLLRNETNSNSYRFAARNLNGEEIWSRDYSISFLPLDMNNDGDVEFYGFRYGNNEFYTNLTLSKLDKFGNIDPSFNLELNDTSHIYDFLVADSDGDNKPDMNFVKMNITNNSYLSAKIGFDENANPTQTFSSIPQIFLTGKFGLIDFNNDQKSEIYDVILSDNNRYYLLIWETNNNYNEELFEFPRYVKDPGNMGCYDC